LNKTNIAAIEGDLLASNNILLHQNSDVILLSLVLLHSWNYMTLLQQLVTQLNSNGILIIIDFDKNENVNHPNIYYGLEPKDIQISLHKIGLLNIDSHTFYQGKNIFMNKDASLFLASGQLT